MARPTSEEIDQMAEALYRAVDSHIDARISERLSQVPEEGASGYARKTEKALKLALKMVVLGISRAFR